MTATDKPARRTISAEEKAREALGVAERKVKRLRDEQSKHNKAAGALTPQIAEAEATRDYLAQHPALKPPKFAVADPTSVAKYEAGE